MKLYKLGGLVAVLICLGILVYSYLSWQDKLQGAAGANTEASAESKTQTAAPKTHKPMKTMANL